MAPPNDTTPLTPMTASRALKILIENLDWEITHAADIHNNTAILIISNLLALISGISYYKSASKAAARYSNNGIFKQYIQIDNGLTNAGFNAECFNNILDCVKATSSQAKQYLTGTSSEKLEWIVATLTGLFVVWPVWDLGLSKSAISDTITTIAALLNWPVNADGTKSLINWMESFDFKDRICDFFHADPKVRNKHIALREARDKLVAHLLEQAKNFGSLQKAQRTNYFQQFGFSLPKIDVEQPAIINRNFDWQSTLVKILTADMPKGEAKVTSMAPSVLIWSLFSLFAIGGIYQNFGYTVVTYNGAKKVWNNKYFAWFASIMELIPTLGFSIKGLLVDHNIIKDYMTGTKSLESIEEPNKFLALSICSGLLALASGFTADQANYEGWKKCFGGETEAWISGIVGNAATAATYNDPQCLLFAQRCLQLYMLRQNADPELKAQMSFIDGIKSLAAIIQKMPMDKFEEFVKEMSPDLFSSLESCETKGKLSADNLAILQQIRTANPAESAAAITPPVPSLIIPAPAPASLLVN